MSTIWKKRILRFWLGVSLPMTMILGFLSYNAWQDAQAYSVMIISTVDRPIDVLAQNELRQEFLKSMQKSLNLYAAFVNAGLALLFLPLLILGLAKLGAWIWGAEPEHAKVTSAPVRLQTSDKNEMGL